MFEKISVAAAIILFSAGPSFAGVTCTEPAAPTQVDGTTSSAQQVKDAIKAFMIFQAGADYYQRCVLLQFREQQREAASDTPPRTLPSSIESDVAAKDEADQRLKAKVGDSLNAAIAVYKKTHTAEPQVTGQSAPSPRVSMSCDPFPPDYPVRPVLAAPQVVDYPAASIAANEQGRVLVSFDIDTYGSVGSRMIVQSSGFPRLDDAVLAAMSNWKFVPVTAGVTPVSFRDSMYVNFALSPDAMRSTKVALGDSCVVHTPHSIHELLIPTGPHFAGYPTLAIRLNQEGTVGVAITVRVDGTVSDPEILLSSGNPQLDQAALDSALLWLYQPVPQPVQVVIDVQFGLT